MASKILGVRLDDDLRESLEQFADEDCLTLSEEVRLALDDYVAQRADK